MLMMIGPVQLRVWPFNAEAYDHSHEASYAEKPVLGARPPFEWVGEGREKWTILGRLFPKRFGGLSGLDALRAARASGSPQYLMRGDGRMMGWVVILSVSESSTHLAADGVGQVIDVSIEVARASRPSSGQFFGAIARLFG